MKERLEEFYEKGIDACKNEKERRNFQRNQKLIDFEFIPETISKVIIESYINLTHVKDKMKIYQYFLSNRMKNLLESINEF
jgi:hypothetical protein